VVDGERIQHGAMETEATSFIVTRATERNRDEGLE
jgi:hypothetical protein